tara:strand:+ start:17737 stop:18186 length:450 start_codon:yes stop_codon:yes gene_type:complete
MVPMRTFTIITAALLGLTLSASLADAQKPGRRDRNEQAATPQRINQTDVGDTERALPYLAYTLGELHYLAFACDGLEAQRWRQHMVDLLAMEAPEAGNHRDRLIESFNDGYRVQQRYRPVCGPEVEAQRTALAHRGQDLAEMLRAANFD